MLGEKKSVFLLLYLLGEKWRNITFPVRLETLNQCFVFNLQVCSLKEKRYLGIFIWSVRIQNDVFVACPYLEWEQYPGGFEGLNDVDSNTFTESLSNWGCTSGRAASGPRVASEAMWQYGIGKDQALSPAKNTWEMVGPREKWSEFECHFEGWEFNDKLL